MRSTEVYGILRDEIAPWAKLQGFKRGKTLLSWHRPHAGMHVVFWFQVAQGAWDDYAGSQFVMEFQLSEEPEVGGRPRYRRRLAALLDGRGREELRTLQNEVIGSLPSPPRNHPLLQVPGLRRGYLARFERVTAHYSPNDDVWLRYRTADDVRRWAHLVLRHLPASVDQVETWSDAPPQ